MQKNLLFSALAALVLLSGCSQNTKSKEQVEEVVDGYEVYKKHCQVCHVEMMKSQEALSSLDTLSAPPMLEVSTHLKEMILVKGGDEDLKRELVLTFIRDYIVSPSIDKSMCHLGALDRFDVMPSFKGKLTDAERAAVAQWVYDRYEGIEF